MKTEETILCDLTQEELSEIIGGGSGTYSYRIINGKLTLVFIGS